MKIQLLTEVTIHDLDDLTAIEYSGNGCSPSITVYRTTDIKKQLAAIKVRPDNILSISFNRMHSANRWTDAYLKRYLAGNWGDFGTRNRTGDYLLPIKPVLSGDRSNLFFGSPSNDGYLRCLDRTILKRKIVCEFSNGRYNLLNLQHDLMRDNRFSDFKIEEIPYYNADRENTHTLFANYLPEDGQLDKWLAKGYQSVGGSYGLIHNLPVVAQHQKSTPR